MVPFSGKHNIDYSFFLLSILYITAFCFMLQFTQQSNSLGNEVAQVWCDHNLNLYNYLRALERMVVVESISQFSSPLGRVHATLCNDRKAALFSSIQFHLHYTKSQGHASNFEVLMGNMLGKLLQVFSEEKKHTQTFERDILLLHHVKS